MLVVLSMEVQMCYSNCPNERLDGSCKGRIYLCRIQPHCVEDEDWIEFKDDETNFNSHKIDIALAELG